MYKLGAVPSPKDSRDYVVRVTAPVQLAPALDLRPLLQPIRNQGSEGSCVGHATTGLFAYFQKVKPSKESPFNRILSVRDSYEGARKVEPVDGEGSYPRAALKYAMKTGLCLEAEWPYSPGNRGVEPINPVSRTLNRVGSYAQVQTHPQGIKQALTLYGPLLIVVPVSNGFFRPDASGRIVDTKDNQGYHAVNIVGYDDSTFHYIIRNSWGTGWGADGYAYLPYSYPITEAWSITPQITDTAIVRPFWADWFPWLPWM